MSLSLIRILPEFLASDGINAAVFSTIDRGRLTVTWLSSLASYTLTCSHRSAAETRAASRENASRAGIAACFGLMAFSPRWDLDRASSHLTRKPAEMFHG